MELFKELLDYGDFVNKKYLKKVKLMEDHCIYSVLQHNKKEIL